MMRPYQGNSEPNLKDMLQQDSIFERVAQAGGHTVDDVITLCENTQPQIKRSVRSR